MHGSAASCLLSLPDRPGSRVAMAASCEAGVAAVLFDIGDNLDVIDRASC